MRKKDSNKHRAKLREQALPKFHKFPLAQKPDNLSKIASQHWDSVIPKLNELGLITELDKPMLVMICELWALWWNAVKVVQKGKMGFLRIKECGNIEVHPALVASENIEQRLVKLMKEFGMTPASRPRVDRVQGMKISSTVEGEVEREPEKTGWEAFL